MAHAFTRLTEKIRRNIAWQYSRFSGYCPAGSIGIEYTPSPAQLEAAPIEIFEPFRFISPDSFRQLAHWKGNVPVRDRHDKSSHINPLFPCYYGLVLGNAFLNEENEKDLAAMRGMANFILENSISDDRGLSLVYKFDFPKFHLKPPWVAGITQALAALLMLRLYAITSSDIYLRHARGFLDIMLTRVEDGGTMRESPEGLPWFEEYPGTRPSYVLNGFMFSLIAMMEGIRSGLHFHFDAALAEEALFRSLEHYVCRDYIRYDRLNGKFCSPHYTGLQALLSLELREITGNETYAQIGGFLAGRTNWELYFDSVGETYSRSNREWLGGKFGQIF